MLLMIMAIEVTPHPLEATVADLLDGHPYETLE
jgi:hypothetical protein